MTFPNAKRTDTRADFARGFDSFFPPLPTVLLGVVVKAFQRENRKAAGTSRRKKNIFSRILDQRAWHIFSRLKLISSEVNFIPNNARIIVNLIECAGCICEWAARGRVIG